MGKKELKNNMLKRYGNTKVSQMTTNDMLDLEAGYEANNIISCKSFDLYKEGLSFIGKIYVSAVDSVRGITTEEMKTIDNQILYYETLLSDPTLSEDMKKIYIMKHDKYVQIKIDIAEKDKDRIVKIVSCLAIVGSLFAYGSGRNIQNSKEDVISNLKDENDHQKEKPEN